jgi:hypothetical protein
VGLKNKTTRVNVHFPDKLIAAIDAHAARMTATDPAGRTYTRADAMRALLVAGLVAERAGADPGPEAYEGAPARPGRVT